MRHAIDRKLTLDLKQTRRDDTSLTWEHLKTGPARELVVTLTTPALDQPLQLPGPRWRPAVTRC
jgi:hypothetical protein